MAAAIPILALFLVILNIKLSNWLFGEKRKKISETDGEVIHRWMVIAFVLIGLIIYFTFIDTYAAKWLFLGYIIVIYSFQSFMEWKYLKESKQFIIPLILMVVGIIFISGVYFINDQMKYTTFQEVVSEQLDEETTVRSISIYINDLSDNMPVIKASTSIEDEEIINKILGDFSNMELKKVDRIPEHGAYRIRIITTNQVAEDHYSTESFYVVLDERYINLSAERYKIVSGTDHLKTIESLVESEEINWESMDQ